MNRIKHPFLNLPPKVLVLDDDHEIIQDIKILFRDEIKVLGVDNIKDALSLITVHYSKFIICVQQFFNDFKQQLITPHNIEHYYQDLKNNSPITVSLIDLNLGESHGYEGFEICEQLNANPIHKLIFTGQDFDATVPELLNQGIINGYLSKSDDLFENILPAIYIHNKQFYYEHFNLIHLMALTSQVDFNTSELGNFLSDINQKNYIFLNDEVFFLTNEL